MTKIAPFLTIGNKLGVSMKASRSLAPIVTVGLVFIAASACQEHQQGRSERTRAPNIMNVAKIESNPTAPTLVHLTQEQFERAKAGLTGATDGPGNASSLMLKALPGGGALVFPDCHPGPGEACEYDVAIEKGPIGQPPSFHVTCKCSPVSPVKPERPSDVAKPRCGPVVMGWGNIIGCVKGTCSGQCTPKMMPQPDDSLLVWCECA